MWRIITAVVLNLCMCGISYAQSLPAQQKTVSNMPASGATPEQRSDAKSVEDFYGGAPANKTADTKSEVSAASGPSVTPPPQVLRQAGSADHKAPALTGRVQAIAPTAAPAKSAPVNNQAGGRQNKVGGGPILPSAYGKPGEEIKAAITEEKGITVLPEVAQAVDVSSTDTNRIVCPGAIKDVITSQEKGIVVHYTQGGQNAFIKFRIALKNGQEVYATMPTEIYVICADSVYNLVAVPRRIPAVTVRLSTGKQNAIKQNQAIFGSMPLEKKILQFIKYVYTDAIPESFEVRPQNKRLKIWKNADITFKKLVLVEGEGLQLKEFIVKNRGTEPLRIDEKQFLKNDFTTNTLGVSIGDGRFLLKSSEGTRVFIVEQTGQQAGGNYGIKR